MVKERQEDHVARPNSRSILMPAFVCAILFALAVQSAERDPLVQSESQPQYTKFLDVGGYRLHLNVQGQFGKDPPITILLESGGGADSTQWSDLQPRLVSETGATVVSYDRAGFGQSDLPDEPYDIVKEVDNLHTALSKLGLGDRLVLVGHSFGGLLIQIYASRWPQNVVGLLFLDPNTPSAMLAMGGASALPAPKSNPTTKKERAFARIDITGIEPYVAAYRSPLPSKIPVIVLSAERGLFPTARQNRAFRASHELLAASVDDGELVVALQSNHNIWAKRPDLVLESVKKLLSKGNGAK